MTTINLQIGAGADDGDADNPALAANLTNSLINVGDVNGNSNSVGAFRFAAVAIPQGATINSATLTVTAYSTYSTGSTISIIVRAHANDNAPALTTANGNLSTSTRPRTTAGSAAIDLHAVTGGAEYPITITNVIQEIVDRSGWNNGNAIVLLADNNNSSASEWQELEAYNHGTGKAAKLAIDYTAAGGPISGSGGGAMAATEAAGLATIPITAAAAAPAVQAITATASAAIQIAGGGGAVLDSLTATGTGGSYDPLIADGAGSLADMEAAGLAIIGTAAIVYVIGAVAGGRAAGTITSGQASGSATGGRSTGIVKLKGRIE